MKPYLLFSAREHSTRAPNKMLRQLIGSDCLFDIYLRRFKRLMDSGRFCDGAVALYPGDQRLYGLALRAHVPVLERSAVSIEKGQPLNVIFECLTNVKADNVLWVNGCQPFLRDSTLLQVSEFARATAVKRICAIPLWTDSSRARSDKNGALCYANSFHAYVREELLTSGEYWPTHKPEPIPVSDEESLDADTELDLEILGALMEHRLPGKANFAW